LNRLKRAERWHHSNRKKKKAVKILKNWHTFDDPNYFPSDRNIGITATTPKSCSCSMCCNERRNKSFKNVLTETDDQGIIHRIEYVTTISKKDRITKQERKNLQSFKDQLDEL
jgi:hypothetical protein